MFEQEAIRVLEMQYKDAKDSYSSHGEHCANAITVAIEALEKQKNDAWKAIDFLNEETYPETLTYVLFTDGNEIFIGYCDCNYEWDSTNGEDSIQINDVIAWKPLPEPYKVV